MGIIDNKPTLNETLIDLFDRVRHWQITDDNLAREAGILATHTLVTAAYGGELPEPAMLRTLAIQLPQPSGSDTVLARSITAIANGAPVSPYKTLNTTRQEARTVTARGSAKLGRRIIPVRFIPAIEAPQDIDPYPVIIESDTEFLWDDGGFRFNKTRGGSSRIAYTNARLLTRGVLTRYVNLIEQYGPESGRCNTENTNAYEALRAIAMGTPFMNYKLGLYPPEVDPAAIFVDARLNARTLGLSDE
jgi:hypothetical protein